MKPFNFNLNVLLQVREKREQTAMQKYARLLSDYSQKSGELSGLEAELEACERKFSDLSQSSAPAVQYTHFAMYHGSLETQYATAKHELAEAQERLRVSWEEYLGAHRDREIISSFRDKQHSTHLTLEQKLEQSEMDELGLRSFSSEYLSPEKHPEIWN
jgi:flagellar export protein FliJ